MKKSRKIWLVAIGLMVFGAQNIRADLLTELLIDKRFEPKTLSAAEADSILEEGQKTAALKDERQEGTVWTTGTRYVLQESNRKPIYRHSYTADYSLYDKAKKQTFPVGEGLREVTFSPDRRYLVYGKGQDLYIFKLDYRTEVAITQGGISDWLYEEEFGRTKLFWFSPDSKQIAFVRLDETDVPTFEWQTFIENLYPKMHSLRYPKAGCANAKAEVCVYDIYTKAIKRLQVGEVEDTYIPSLVWRSITTGKGKNQTTTYEVIVEKINRDQTTMEVRSCNPQSTVGKLLYREEAKEAFCDYDLFNHWLWLSDGRFIVLSEKDGWRQLFLYSKEGKQLQALTPAGMDITDIYGFDEKSGTVYYQAAVQPSERQVMAVTLKNGTITALTSEAGMNSLQLSEDGKRGIIRFESDQVAPRYTLYSIQGTKMTRLKEVLNNNDIQEAWQQAGLPQKEFGTIPTERGDTLEAWFIYPQEMKEGQKDDVQRKFPVVMFQYSGPASQRVLNRWRHRFAHYLASEGYIVVNADPRGTDCRGRKWRNETYMDLGTKEAEDQLSVARYMASLPYVDKDRIAMIGWSYGGYQTVRTMCEQDPKNPLIACGIAIAPVTDWRLYDTGYTERFMRRPQVNEGGYEAADLLNKAKQLSGELLLIHGTGDDNVHYQNSLLLSDALVKAGKQFDLQLYVDDNHSMRKPANYEHLHRRILRFLKEKL